MAANCGGVHQGLAYILFANTGLSLLALGADIFLANTLADIFFANLEASLLYITLGADIFFALALGADKCFANTGVPLLTLGANIFFANTGGLSYFFASHFCFLFLFYIA